MATIVKVMTSPDTEYVTAPCVAGSLPSGSSSVHVPAVAVPMQSPWKPGLGAAPADGARKLAHLFRCYWSQLLSPT
jgi:hypothetical protein